MKNPEVGRPTEAVTSLIQPGMRSRVGLVLSGGGSRGAYQVGVLRALLAHAPKHLRQPSIIVGSSLGAINGIILGAGLKRGLPAAVELLETLWRQRTFENTFSGSISRSFLRAIQVAILRYGSPGPCASNVSIFDPSPLMNHINHALTEAGGVSAENLLPGQAIAVMTTIEGSQRKPMLLTCLSEDFDDSRLQGSTFDMVRLTSLTAEHGLASAALPSVLPAVDLDLKERRVRLVDGGICDNIPVDPALRLGAEELIVLDVSGRRWWFDHYGQPHYTRPKWEVPAGITTYCLCPQRKLEFSNEKALGPLLKQSVGQSRRDFMLALGPTWPIFKILKHKMGEDLAYEVMTYVALHPQFVEALIEQGYQEATEALKAHENASNLAIAS